MPGLFDDLMPVSQSTGMFDDLVDEAPVEPERKRPLIPAWASTVGRAVLAPALGPMNLPGGRALTSKLSEIVGGVLSVPRELTTDPLAQSAVRAAGMSVPEVVEASGQKRSMTAPELLVQGLMPEGENRATSADVTRGVLDLIPQNLLPKPLRVAVESASSGPNILGVLGDIDALVRQHPGLKKTAKTLERMARVPASLGAGVVTDPLTALSGASVVKALGSGVKTKAAASAIDRGLTAVGVLTGGVAAQGGLENTYDAVVKGKIDDALVGLVETLAGAGMATLAGSAHSGLKKAKSTAEAAIDRGPAYVHDPALTAEQRAVVASELAAKESAEGRAAAQPRTDAMADLRAADPLDLAAGRSAGPKRLRAEPEPSTAGTSPEAQDYAAQRLAEDEASLSAPVEPTRAKPPEKAGFEGDPTRGGGVGPRSSHELIQQGKPVVELVAMRDKLAAKLEAGTLSDAEIPVLLRLNEAIKYREAELSAATQVRAIAAVDPAARKATGTASSEDYAIGPNLPRLSEGEAAALAEALPEASAPERGPRLATSAVSRALVADRRLAPGVEGPQRPSRVVTPKPPDLAPVGRTSPRAGQVAVEVGARAEAVPAGQLEGAYKRLTRTALQTKLSEIIAAKKSEQARALSNQEAAARQRELVAMDEAGVGEGRGSAMRIGDRTITLKDAYTHLEALPRVGRQLAGIHRAEALQRETLSGKLKTEATEALAPLGDKPAAEFEPVARALDGEIKPETLTPPQRTVYDRYRRLLDESYSAYADAYEKATGKSPAKREADYFPRASPGENLIDIETQAATLASEKNIPLDEAMRKLRGNDVVIATRSDRRGAFETERSGRLEDIRRDPAVVLEYLDVLARRTAELTHYGKNGERLSSLIAQLPDTPSSRRGLKVGDREFAQKFFDRSRNVVPTGLATQAGHIVRSLGGLHDLVWAFTQQPLSYAQTAAAAGIGPTIRGALKTVAGEVRAADFRSPRRLATAMKNSMSKAGLDSDRVAATSRHVTEDMLNATTTAPGGDTVLGKVQALSNKAPWIRAMLALDRGGRMAAVQTWRAVGADLIAKAKSGNAAEQRNLTRMGIDWKSIDPANSAAMDAAAKSFSDATQYRASIGSLPPWASSPGGRMAFQYLSFIKSHTSTIRNMGAEAAKGNVKPVLRFAAVGIPLAVLSLEFKDRMRGYGWDDDEITAENVLKKTREAMTGRARPDPTKGGYAALAYAARVGSVLGVGTIYQAMIERTGGDSPLKALPAGKYIDAGYKAATGVATTTQTRAAAAATSDPVEKARLSDEADKSSADTSKTLSKFAGSFVPDFLGAASDVGQLVSSDKTRKANFGGRLRDVLEDRGVIASADPTAAGSEGRKRTAKLADVREEKTSAQAKAKALLDPRNPASLATRLSETEKEAVLAEIRLAYIDAIRTGDRVGALRAQLAAGRLGKPFSRKLRFDLQRRTLRAPVYTEDAQEAE